MQGFEVKLTVIIITYVQILSKRKIKTANYTYKLGESLYYIRVVSSRAHGHWNIFSITTRVLTVGLMTFCTGTTVIGVQILSDAEKYTIGDFASNQYLT